MQSSLVYKACLFYVGRSSKRLSCIHESALVLFELRCAVNHQAKERQACLYTNMYVMFRIFQTILEYES